MELKLLKLKVYAVECMLFTADCASINACTNYIKAKYIFVSKVDTVSCTAKNRELVDCDGM
jgi:hypothetical protein